MPHVTFHRSSNTVRIGSTVLTPNNSASDLRQRMRMSYNKAAERAYHAATRAAQSGTSSDHRAAADAHKTAQRWAYTLNDTPSALEHKAAAASHMEQVSKLHLQQKYGGATHSGTATTRAARADAYAKSRGLGANVPKGETLAGSNGGVQTSRGKTVNSVPLGDKTVKVAKSTGMRLSTPEEMRPKVEAATLKAQQASSTANAKDTIGAHDAARVAHKQAASLHGSMAKAQHAAGAHVQAQDSERKAQFHRNAATHHESLAREKQMLRDPGNQRELELIKSGARKAGAVLPKDVMAQVKLHAKLTEHNLSMGNDNAAHYHARKALELKHDASDHASYAKASAHAALKSEAAKTKPSLMGHTIAAKAHEHAETQSTSEAQSVHHKQQAEWHRAQARVVSHQIHSLRVKKIKPEGPGQRHGQGGRFIGKNQAG